MGGQRPFPNIGGDIPCSKEAVEGGDQGPLAGTQFTPPGGYPGKLPQGLYTYGFGNDDAGGGTFKFSIIDLVQIPESLPTGDYTLSFRWDSEQGTQVWTSCADVHIADKDSTALTQENICIRPVHGRCSIPERWARGRDEHKHSQRSNILNNVTQRLPIRKSKQEPAYQEWKALQN